MRHCLVLCSASILFRTFVFRHTSSPPPLAVSSSHRHLQYPSPPPVAFAASSRPPSPVLSSQLSTTTSPLPLSQQRVRRPSARNRGFVDSSADHDRFCRAFAFSIVGVQHLGVGARHGIRRRAWCRQEVVDQEEASCRSCRRPVARRDHSTVWPRRYDRHCYSPSPYSRPRRSSFRAGLTLRGLSPSPTICINSAAVSAMTEPTPRGEAPPLMRAS